MVDSLIVKESQLTSIYTSTHTYQPNTKHKSVQWVTYTSLFDLSATIHPSSGYSLKMNCSCGPMCQQTSSILEFLRLPGQCNLVIEAQWGIVALVVIGLMFAVIVVESITLIVHGCRLCCDRRKSKDELEFHPVNIRQITPL